MANVTKIEIENFRGIDNETIHLSDKNGIVALLGETGAAKTSILDAVSWCINGKNIPDLIHKDFDQYDTLQELESIPPGERSDEQQDQIQDLRNEIDDQMVRVRLEFEGGYELYRSLRRSGEKTNLQPKDPEGNRMSKSELEEAVGSFDTLRLRPERFLSDDISIQELIDDIMKDIPFRIKSRHSVESDESIVDVQELLYGSIPDEGTLVIEDLADAFGVDLSNAMPNMTGEPFSPQQVYDEMDRPVHDSTLADDLTHLEEFLVQLRRSVNRKTDGLYDQYAEQWDQASRDYLGLPDDEDIDTDNIMSLNQNEWFQQKRSTIQETVQPILDTVVSTAESMNMDDVDASLLEDLKTGDIDNVPLLKRATRQSINAFRHTMIALNQEEESSSDIESVEEPSFWDNGAVELFEGDYDNDTSAPIELSTLIDARQDDDFGAMHNWFRELEDHLRKRKITLRKDREVKQNRVDELRDQFKENSEEIEQLKKQRKQQIQKKKSFFDETFSNASIQSVNDIDDALDSITSSIQTLSEKLDNQDERLQGFLSDLNRLRSYVMNSESPDDGVREATTNFFDKYDTEELQELMESGHDRLQNLHDRKDKLKNAKQTYQSLEESIEEKQERIDTLEETNQQINQKGKDRAEEIENMEEAYETIDSDHQRAQKLMEYTEYRAREARQDESNSSGNQPLEERIDEAGGRDELRDELEKYKESLEDEMESFDAIESLSGYQNLMATRESLTNMIESVRHQLPQILYQSEENPYYRNGLFYDGQAETLIYKHRRFEDLSTGEATDLLVDILSEMANPGDTLALDGGESLGRDNIEELHETLSERSVKLLGTFVDWTEDQSIDFLPDNNQFYVEDGHITPIGEPSSPEENESNPSIE